MGVYNADLTTHAPLRSRSPSFGILRSSGERTAQHKETQAWKSNDVVPKHRGKLR